MKETIDQAWSMAELASVSEVFTDGNWIETKDQSTGGIRLVQTGNIGEGNFKDRRDKARWIDGDTFDRLKCFEVLPGDCLVSRLPDPVGRTCIIPETGDKMITAVDCTVIRPDEAKIEPRFFVYYSQSAEYLKNVDEVCTGTTRRRISRKNLGKIPIPLPPLEEQQRIVAVLDEAFEGLTRARAHAEANLQNARELFIANVDSLLSRVGDDWSVGPLSKLVGQVATGPFGSLLHKSDYVENETPLVNPANIIDGRIIPDARKTVNESALARLSSYILDAGDIVVGRRGEMGRCAVVEIGQTGWLCGTGSFFIRPNKGVVSKFVAHLLRSPSYVARLEAASTGATMANLSNRILGDLEIALPSREKQFEYLEWIDDFNDATIQLESSFIAKLQDLDDLRQSLLQKSFAGELT